MHAITALFAAVLFVLLTPGVILRIPSKGPLLHASIVHAIIFGILIYFIYKLVYQNKNEMESFQSNGIIGEIYSVNDIRCNPDNCNASIDTAINERHPIPSKWWSMDGEKAGGGCTGCTLPNNVKIIPDPNSGTKPINMDSKGCNNSVPEPTDPKLKKHQPVSALTENKCNPEKCKKYISDTYDEYKDIYLDDWNNKDKDCYGCTLPLNVKIFPEDEKTYIVNTANNEGCYKDTNVD